MRTGHATRLAASAIINTYFTGTPPRRTTPRSVRHTSAVNAAAGRYARGGGGSGGAGRGDAVENSRSRTALGVSGRSAAIGGGISPTPKIEAITPAASVFALPIKQI